MSFLAADWASPRSAVAFTGYVGNPIRDGPGGPSGTLALCVANTPIPCKLEGMAQQKSIQFTVMNIRKKGWSYAPWFVFLLVVFRICFSLKTTMSRKRSTGKNAKAVKDENTKELFENGEWARNDITMERVGSSVLMYSFIKDGQVFFVCFLVVCVSCFFHAPNLPACLTGQGRARRHGREHDRVGADLPRPAAGFHVSFVFFFFF